MLNAKLTRINESERVSVKQARDATMLLAEHIQTHSSVDMKISFDAALILWNAIIRFEQWNCTSFFNGTGENISTHNGIVSSGGFYRDQKHH